MTNIHNLGPDASSRYAKDQQTLLEYEKQYKVSPDRAQFIKHHAQVLDKTVRPPQIDVLMGTNQKKNWAQTRFPMGYFADRPTSKFVLAPPEQLAADQEKLVAVMEEEFQKAGGDQNPESAKQDLPGQPLLNVVVEASDYNSMVEQSVGAMNAFLQG